MKCDFCNEEYNEVDLVPVMAYRKAKYMCYKCRSKGDSEVKKHKITGMEKKGLIGDK
jgi:hypothetical protein